MLPLLRTRNRYPEHAGAIIKKLSTYTHESFLRRLYEHFQVYKNPAHGVALNYPWCCFLALKWKFIVPEKERAAVMSERDFVAVINRIYLLQDEATDLYRAEGIFLEMRRMIVNQAFYQSNVRTYATSLARQYIWYCRSPSPFYRDRFFSLTGLRLEDYFGMAHFLMAVFHRDTRRESGSFPLSKLILYMVPKYGVEAVGTFLRLISLRPGNIGAFITDYKRPTPVPEEYYERTPFIRRPVLLYEDAAIVFSKQLLGAGLSSLVPELFKENHTGDYGSRFGSTVERYLEKHLTQTFSELQNEETLKSRYKRASRTGKVVDYLIREGEAYVFIDSKAVLPHRILRESASAHLLHDRIKGNLIEGLEKGEKCAAIINEIEHRLPSRRDSLIIVLQQDHFISSGQFIAANIKPDIFDVLRAELHHLPVPEDRIYFLTIDDLEVLTDVCRIRQMTVTEIIDMCSEADVVPRTQKMDFRMHLSALLPDGYQLRPEIKDVIDELSDGTKEFISHTSQIWDGRAGEYMRIREFLLRSCEEG